ncbi:hypothetical protein KL928_000376 [Ogataea angusta]|uniref:Uncharacterized protein n=1 Tax=Pichia angusta TaxID=870730 RepID=A0AAN6I7E9_PICAN|nr:uncharacterized protein KL928_000376 [Ogataea angusta]KAG7821901.1 hypothetical protein KL928_000376 [Ogataea angusta]
MDPLHAAVVAEAAARAIKNYEDGDGVWPENPGAQGRHNGEGSAHSTKDESQEKFVLDPALQLELEKYGKQEAHDAHDLEHKKQDGPLYVTGNDKIRRSNLEKIGACNRCAKRLKESDRDHKVCERCRTKKKRGLSVSSPPNKRIALAEEHHNGSKHGGQQASAEAVAAAVLNRQQSGHDQDILLPENFHNLPHIHHSQLNQQLNQQLHQQLSQLGQDHSSSNTDDEEVEGSSHEEDVGGSLTIPNPDRICLKCGNHIHIDDLSFNPAASICSKCLENDDDPETTANLFMNPEGDVIGKNA